jgi:hypothetical protein
VALVIRRYLVPTTKTSTLLSRHHASSKEKARFLLNIQPEVLSPVVGLRLAIRSLVSSSERMFESLPPMARKLNNKCTFHQFIIESMHSFKTISQRGSIKYRKSKQLFNTLWQRSPRSFRLSPLNPVWNIAHVGCATSPIDFGVRLEFPSA